VNRSSQSVQGNTGKERVKSQVRHSPQMIVLCPDVYLASDVAPY
jgi:hypothetical protein